MNYKWIAMWVGILAIFIIGGETITFFLLPSQAYEIDAFWHRKPPPRDSLESVDAEVNRRLQKAVETTKTCDLEEFYTNVHNQLNAESQLGGAIAGMEEWAVEQADAKNPQLDLIRPPDLKKSVYGGAHGPSTVVYWLEIYEKAMALAREQWAKEKGRTDRQLETLEHFLMQKSRGQIIVERCHVPENLREQGQLAVEEAIEPKAGKSKARLSKEDQEMVIFFQSLAKSVDGGKSATCIFNRVKDFSFIDGEKGAIRGGLEPTMLMNGHYVGVDKLGHFFSQGYEYFHEAYVHDKVSSSISQKKDGIKSALALGKREEESWYGWSTTGVKSFGDLSANYGGMLFWHQLTQGEQPLYVCRNGRFVLRDPNYLFTFAHYVTDAWDEAINCSEYVSVSVAAAVSENLKNADMSCPIDAAKCVRLRSQYPALIYKEIVSPDCQNTRMPKDAKEPSRGTDGHSKKNRPNRPSEGVF